MTGIELIVQERKEQIEKHGRSIESDAFTNTGYQLAEAAAKLIEYPEGPHTDPDYVDPPKNWKESAWIKISKKSYKERLIISGALIAAEIDRINFTEQKILMFKLSDGGEYKDVVMSLEDCMHTIESGDNNDEGYSYELEPTWMTLKEVSELPEACI